MLLEANFRLTHDVFVSRPTATTDFQSKFCNDLENALRIRGLRIRSLGTTDYSNKAPLLGVRQLLNNCEGVIVLGLKQVFVKDCVEKDGTNKKKEGRKFFLPTAWNHLEGGIAFALNLPLLIIVEEGVEGGIFDQGVTDRFIHHINLSFEGKDEIQTNSYIEKYFASEGFLQPLNEWHEEVVLYHWRKKKKEETTAFL
jgi:hypothetical protein